jgi:hypothetical protein
MTPNSLHSNLKEITSSWRNKYIALISTTSIWDGSDVMQFNEINKSISYFSNLVVWLAL